ncbi:hypothetical protein [Enterobacter chengduensis]|uniref:hypothetical protein n=1 Tax=Enterobacter chengduensis TaxID=2494701 RepID=UPI0020034261|nr:hypothetical protein [Enterobacter chengduensis]MCK7452042.1 hypothetical protein [Enterobacter chengduensis]
MRLRILFVILMVCISVSLGGALAYLTSNYLESRKVPAEPCSSVIRNGKFIDESLQHYQFNGVITWWPKLHRLTLFGVKTDEAGNRVFNRTLQLKSMTQKGNVINGRVAELKIAVGDQLPEKTFLISEDGQYINLLFKPINKDSWLMKINDNWVAMCEYK